MANYINDRPDYKHFSEEQKDRQQYRRFVKLLRALSLSASLAFINPGCVIIHNKQGHITREDFSDEDYLLGGYSKSRTKSLEELVQYSRKHPNLRVEDKTQRLENLYSHRGRKHGSLVDFIRKKERDNDIREGWVAAMLMYENNGRAKGTSFKGARGIAQAMPVTFEEFGPNGGNPENTFDGAEFAVAYFSHLLKIAKGNYFKATSYYNTGPYSGWLNSRYVEGIAECWDYLRHNSSQDRNRMTLASPSKGRHKSTEASLSSAGNVEYAVKKGDTLGSISSHLNRKYGVGYFDPRDFRDGRGRRQNSNNLQIGQKLYAKRHQ